SNSRNSSGAASQSTTTDNSIFKLCFDPLGCSNHIVTSGLPSFFQLASSTRISLPLTAQPPPYTRYQLRLSPTHTRVRDWESDNLPLPHTRRKRRLLRPRH